MLLEPVKKQGGQEVQGLGRSCGGFITKIHAVCDALGNPLDFIITAGQVSDDTQAAPCSVIKSILLSLQTKVIIAMKSFKVL